MHESFEAQAIWVDIINWRVLHIRVKVYSTQMAYWILADKSADHGVVEPRAVVVQPTAVVVLAPGVGEPAEQRRTGLVNNFTERAARVVFGDRAAVRGQGWQIKNSDPVN